MQRYTRPTPTGDPATIAFIHRHAIKNMETAAKAISMAHPAVLEICAASICEALDALILALRPTEGQVR